MECTGKYLYIIQITVPFLMLIYYLVYLVPSFPTSCTQFYTDGRSIFFFTLRGNKPKNRPWLRAYDFFWSFFKMTSFLNLFKLCFFPAFSYFSSFPSFTYSLLSLFLTFLILYFPYSLLSLFLTSISFLFCPFLLKDISNFESQKITCGFFKFWLI